MKLTPRWIVLLGLLAGSAGLVAFSEPPKGAADVVAPTVRANASSRVTAGELPTGMILAILPRGPATASADVFASHNWNPPPPPPPKPAAPAKPSAPPMPFTVLGKKHEDGRWEVFLARQDQTFIVKAQDVIGGMYRVETIQPPTMTLTYLPLNESQTVAIGGTE